ncbi:hypothetical protein VTG60DRAFT_5135 [Thermothelomyces hinnuleus]
MVGMAQTAPSVTFFAVEASRIVPQRDKSVSDWSPPTRLVPVPVPKAARNSLGWVRPKKRQGEVGMSEKDGGGSSLRHDFSHDLDKTGRSPVVGRSRATAELAVRRRPEPGVWVFHWKNASGSARGRALEGWRLLKARRSRSCSLRKPQRT